MPLSIQSTLSFFDPGKTGWAPYCVYIYYHQLGQTYSLTGRDNGSTVLGKLENITPLETPEEKGAFEKIRGKKMEFYYLRSASGGNDLLFLSTRSWDMIREAGFVGFPYNFHFILESMVKEGISISIYPLRKVF